MSRTEPQGHIEQELLSVLTRHLPVGMEGIAAAQADATFDLLHRRMAHRYRVFVDENARGGMQALRQTANEHRDSTTTGLAGRACGRCRGSSGDPEPWPCPVWRVAVLLGVARDRPPPGDGVGEEASPTRGGVEPCRA